MVQHENQKHELQKFLSLIRCAFKTGNVNGAKIREFFEYIVSLVNFELINVDWEVTPLLIVRSGVQFARQ